MNPPRRARSGVRSFLRARAARLAAAAIALAALLPVATDALAQAAPPAGKAPAGKAPKGGKKKPAPAPAPAPEPTPAPVEPAPETPAPAPAAPPGCTSDDDCAKGEVCRATKCVKHAAEAAPAPAPAAKGEGPIEITVGLKLSAGGDVWTAPSSPPSSTLNMGFVDTGGGFAWGGGAYVEARALKFLALEVGLGLDKLTIQRKVNVSIAGVGSTDVTEKVDVSSIRIPVLAKLVLPLPLLRLSLGAGPDFLVANGATPSLTATPIGNVTPTMPTLLATQKTSTMITGELGLTIELPIGIDIPIALRASKNLSQEDAYDKRVARDPLFPAPGTSANVLAQPSIDARLLVGVGYRF